MWEIVVDDTEQTCRLLKEKVQHFKPICSQSFRVNIQRTQILSSPVGNVQPEITEDDLSVAFSVHGELQRVHKLEAKNCAFVTFRNRADAEEAADKLQNRLVVRGTRLRIMWGRPQANRGPADAAAPSGAPSVRFRLKWSYRTHNGFAFILRFRIRDTTASRLSSGCRRLG